MTNVNDKPYVVAALLRQVLGIGPDDLTAKMLLATAMDKTQAAKFSMAAEKAFPLWKGHRTRDFEFSGKPDAHLKGERDLTKVTISDDLNTAMLLRIGASLGVDLVEPPNRVERDRLRRILVCVMSTDEEPKYLDVQKLFGAPPARQESTARVPMKTEASIEAKARLARTLTSIREQGGCVPAQEVTGGRLIHMTEHHKSAHIPQRGAPVPGTGKPSASSKPQKKASA